MIRKHGKRGALPRNFSKAAPTLEDYLVRKPLPQPTPIVDRLTGVTLPMYANDRLGDCTCAGAGHGIGCMSAFLGTEALFTDTEIIKMYSAVSGYDPATGANDNGAELADVCKYLMTTGITDTNGKLHKLAAWAEIEEFNNLTLLQSVLYNFGTVYCAFQLPDDALDVFDAGQPWTNYSQAPDPNEGHCMVIQYSAVQDTAIWNDETLVTWAAGQKACRAWMRKYLCESIVMVSEDYVNANGTNISGLNLQQMITDAQGL